MTETCFLDTNILVYLFDTSEPAKRQKVKSLFADLQYKKQGYIRDNQCALLYSEDMQHGQRIEGMLTIRNPFL